MTGLLLPAANSFMLSYVVPSQSVNMIVVVLRLRGGGRVHDVLKWRVLILRGSPPYACHNRDADVGEGFLYLLHPLTPFAMLAFRPR